MKIDTMLGGLEDAPAHARRLEELGVDGAFTFEGPHDVFTPLILAAGATTTLELATNVAIAFPRNPVQLAHQAYDLQLLTHGRFSLGLGSQIRAQVEKRYGASFDRPIARIRELVGALRSIFATWETGITIRPGSPEGYTRYEKLYQNHYSRMNESPDCFLSFFI